LTLRAAIVAGLTALSITGLTACESTQSKSAALEKQGSKLLLDDTGLQVEKESTDVKVLSTALLTDANGSAVVVTLRNDSGKDLTNVPISIDVLDAKGKSVYKNDIPGIEQGLAAVPYVPAGGTVDWVHDQILATGKPPKKVKVKVGASTAAFSGALPEIEVSEPAIEGDPVSGIEATGDVVNRTGEEQGRLLLYAVARRGNEVVAAGRGAIDHLRATTKPAHYDIFFIGDPQGADVTVTQFPTLPGEK
jgi:hypothetical protein